MGKERCTCGTFFIKMLNKRQFGKAAKETQILFFFPVKQLINLCVFFP